MMEFISDKLKGREKMGLVMGEPGVGKTETSMHYAAKNGAVILRSIELMTGCWLLRKIVFEFGGVPAHSAEKNLDLIGELILKSSKTRAIIVDEADRLANKPALLETLRDVHDIYHVPVILVGEQGLEKKLMANRKFYRRIVDVFHFEKLDKEGVRMFLSQVSDIRFKDDAVERVAFESKGKISQIITMIYHAEKFARRNNISLVGATDF